MGGGGGGALKPLLDLEWTSGISMFVFAVFWDGSLLMSCSRNTEAGSRGDGCDCIAGREPPHLSPGLPSHLAGGGR